jgi:hypothetical protein
MFQVGDIVELFAPSVGYNKYHLCIKASADGSADQFLYLNSEIKHAGVIAVECARVPCLPPSETGNTCFSFNMIPRYSDKQLGLYKAKKLGEIDSQLATDILAFSMYDTNVKALTGPERKVVREALKAMAEKGA